MIVNPLYLTMILALPVAAQQPEQSAESNLFPAVVGQPAPPLGLSTKELVDPEEAAKIKEALEQAKRQIREGVDPEKVMILGNMADSASQGKSPFEAMAGDVILIHLVDPQSQDATFHTLPLLRDLVLANEDRGLGVIGLAAKQDGLDDFAETFELPWEIVSYPPDSASPYLQGGHSRANYLWVISRSGFVAWQGDPKSSEKALIKKLDALLSAAPAPALEHPLVPALDKAVAAYRDGKWETARKQADKLKKKYSGQKSAEDALIFEDAHYLSSLVSDHEVSLANQALKDLDKRRILSFLQAQAAVEYGFAKSPIRKQLEQGVKDFRRKRVVAGVIEEGEVMFELLEERPVLFPARKTSAGDKLEKELQAYLKRSSFTLQSGQLAEKLLEKYAEAVRVK